MRGEADIRAESHIHARTSHARIASIKNGMEYLPRHSQATLPRAFTYHRSNSMSHICIFCGDEFKSRHLKTLSCRKPECRDRVKKKYKIVWEVDPVTGCWNCTSHRPDCRGYCTIIRGPEKIPLHRYIYEALFGFLEGSHIQVRHKCDNRKCINPEHLEPGTNYDNIMDKVRRGRQARGETSGRAVLSERQVLEIRATPRKDTYSIIAAKYGVTPENIRSIVARKSWKHI